MLPVGFPPLAVTPRHELAGHSKPQANANSYFTLAIALLRGEV